MRKAEKIPVLFRIDPMLKQAAKRVAKEQHLTLSGYIEDLVRRDAWSKGLLRTDRN
jgi:antitoxin component of RelBE/YafQ-DinJ toxin-antitoxin module